MPGYNAYDPEEIEEYGLPQVGSAQGWEPQGSPAPAAGQAAVLQAPTGPADFGPVGAFLVVVAGFVALRLWVHFAPDGE